MILNDTEVTTRLESSLNLVNQLNNLLPKKNSMDLFIGHSKDDQSNTQPSSGLDNDEPEIVDEKKLRLGLVRSLALDVLHDSLNSLKMRIPEVGKARDLSSIARDMKFVLTEDEANAKTATQVVIYKPIINDISKYETMVVVE